MATNQMRREAAKRKLERQQERREQQAKRRQRVAVITSAAVVVVVVVGIVLLTTLGGASDTDVAAPPTDDPAAAEPTEAAPVLGECSFTADGEASKPAPVPDAANAPTEGTVAVTLGTDRGDIPITLDRAKAPCTVESFLSLTAAGFYDQTPCHRLTASETLSVLQCGDPTGSGMGGPGYTVNDEFPTDLPTDPATGSAVYGRGLLAMANTGAPNSGGSQFFLVYGDSSLPPSYTVFGSIDEAGLAVLDQIAAGGTADGAPDGAPAQPVTITQVVPAA